MRSPLAAAAAAAVLTLALAACEEEDPGDGTASDASAADACSYQSDGSGTGEVELPPTEPSVSGEVTATLTTSVGDFVFTLDADRTPCAVNSFVSLAEQGYFDDTICHRVTSWGVLQCGDPTGTGGGGPGYSFADELDGTETYQAGTLAMANSGEDTNGSQFFIVYADANLTPDYTVFGSVDQATVDRVTDVAAAGAVDGAGNPAVDGTPATEVKITGVTID